MISFKQPLISLKGKEEELQQQIILTAPKMSCGHCKMAVETAIGGLAGVNAVTADPETKKIEVSYEESIISVDEIRKASAEAGYQAE